MQFGRGGNWGDEPRKEQKGGCFFMPHLKIWFYSKNREKKKKNWTFIAIFSETLFSHYNFLESKFSRGTDQKGWEIPTRKGSREHKSKKDSWKSKGSAFQHHQLPSGQVKWRGSQEGAQARCEAVETCQLSLPAVQQLKATLLHFNSYTFVIKSWPFHFAEIHVTNTFPSFLIVASVLKMILEHDILCPLGSSAPLTTVPQGCLFPETVSLPLPPSCPLSLSPWLSAT